MRTGFLPLLATSAGFLPGRSLVPMECCLESARAPHGRSGRSPCGSPPALPGAARPPQWPARTVTEALPPDLQARGAIDVTDSAPRNLPEELMGKQAAPVERACPGASMDPEGCTGQHACAWTDPSRAPGRAGAAWKDPRESLPPRSRGGRRMCHPPFPAAPKHCSSSSSPTRCRGSRPSRSPRRLGRRRRSPHRTRPWVRTRRHCSGAPSRS